MDQTMMDQGPDTVPVGEQVLGRVITANGDPLDDKGALAGALRVPIHSAAPAGPAPDGAPEWLETGIKALDLLAPLTRGGTLDLVGPAGVGKLVLIGELIHNLGQRRNAVAVCAGLEEHTYQAGDFVRMMEEMGVADQTAAVFWSRGAPATQRPRVLLAALTIAEHFRDHGQEVVFLVDKKLVPTADLAGIAPRLRPVGLAAITAVLFVPGSDDLDPLPDDPGAPFHPDARVLLTRTLASQGQYPAVDPLVSTSQLLDCGGGGVDQGLLAQQVRELIRRAEDLAPAVVNAKPGMTPSTEEQRILTRARRLQLFLTQPMFVAEPYTGMPGEYVPLAETVRACRAILQGEVDALPEAAFRFHGTLDQVRAAASGLTSDER